MRAPLRIAIAERMSPRRMVRLRYSRPKLVFTTVAPPSKRQWMSSIGASCRGVPAERISFARETYTFAHAGPPEELVDAFRKYYGPTMNAFEAAGKSGRAADLLAELEALFRAQNRGSSPNATSIPATFLRVTVTV